MKTIKNFNIPLIFITSLFITMMFSSCGKNYDSYYELIDGGMYQIAQEKILKEIEKDPTNGKLHQILGDIKLHKFMSKSFGDSVDFITGPSQPVSFIDIFGQAANSIVESYQNALKYDPENELPLINSISLLLMREFAFTYGETAAYKINSFIEINFEKSKGYNNAAIEYIRCNHDDNDKYRYWDPVAKKISKEWIQIVEIDTSKLIKSTVYHKNFIVLKDSISCFYESGKNAGYLSYGVSGRITKEDEDYYYYSSGNYDRWNKWNNYYIRINRGDIELMSELEIFIALSDSVGFVDEEGNQAGFLKYGEFGVIDSETDEYYIFLKKIKGKNLRCFVLKNDVSLTNEIFVAGINYALLGSNIPKDILINLGHFKLAIGFPIITIWDGVSSLTLPFIFDSFKFDSKGTEFIFHTEGNISKKIVVRNGIVESITDYSS